MPDKVDVTIEIENYRMEIHDYFKKYPLVFTVMILLPVPGIFWFIKWTKKKRELDQRRIEIVKMLNELSTTIPLEEYMEMRKRLNSARKY